MMMIMIIIIIRIRIIIIKIIIIVMIIIIIIIENDKYSILCELHNTAKMTNFWPSNKFI